jgi:hypothetical protein
MRSKCDSREQRATIAATAAGRSKTLLSLVTRSSSSNILLSIQYLDRVGGRMGGGITAPTPAGKQDGHRSGADRLGLPVWCYSARSPAATVTVPSSWSQRSATPSALVSAIRNVLPTMTSERSCPATLLNAPEPMNVNASLVPAPLALLASMAERSMRSPCPPPPSPLQSVMRSAVGGVSAHHADRSRVLGVAGGAVRPIASRLRLTR